MQHHTNKLIDYINLKPLEWEGSTIAGDALIMDAENEQSVFTGFSLETMDQHYDPIQKMLIRARKVPDWQAIEALTNLNLSNKVYKYFGKIELKNYTKNILKK